MCVACSVCMPSPHVSIFTAPFVGALGPGLAFARAFLRGLPSLLGLSLLGSRPFAALATPVSWHPRS